MYMHTCIHIYICTCICGATVRGGRWVLLMAALNRYTYIDVYMYIIHIYICIYTHIYIDIYIYVYKGGAGCC